MAADIYRDALDRLIAAEETCVRAMLARWRPEWGKPHLILRPPRHPAAVSSGGRIEFKSDLVALGTPTDDGGIIVRVTVEDVRQPHAEGGADAARS